MIKVSYKKKERRYPLLLVMLIEVVGYLESLTRQSNTYACMKNRYTRKVCRQPYGIAHSGYCYIIPVSINF
jgi:hypothetical protein